jgi:methylthioribose-1-phosphate isomerase
MNSHHIGLVAQVRLLTMAGPVWRGRETRDLPSAMRLLPIGPSACYGFRIELASLRAGAAASGRFHPESQPSLMNIDGRPWRTIWLESDATSVGIIDQTLLPHRFGTVRLTSVGEAAHAIRAMQVRGAPLIGATAAYGLWLALRADASDEALERACGELLATRPTAINLKWALDEMMAAVRNRPRAERPMAALKRAGEIADEDVAINRAIGGNGLALIKQAAARKKGAPVNVLTHCNAGWLATVDVGTALAPIYTAHDAGIAVHVYADETRPRNQGASLTAWELGHHGVPHTVIPDNTGGHLMQHGLVDLVIVGTDRVTAQGDVCNKIGTYLKALAARDNNVPFYVALPSPTIDFTLVDGLAEIPIEQRGADEVATMSGKTADGRIETVQVVPDGSPVANYGFDVTPARLVTGLITERGILDASRPALAAAFPERASAH